MWCRQRTQKCARTAFAGIALPCTLSVAMFLSAGDALAQSMDYGALEALFGEPVTTSVTGSPQRQSEVPASMIIVTADDIRRSGARDIPGVLRHVPGLDVLQWTNDQADVGIRGYNQAYSPRLLVLVDGRQVYADHYGYTPWTTIPVQLSDIRQIEIVMGPNSGLFGFNAVGGVINIVTYDPLYDDVNKASISGGTQGLVQGSGTATMRLDDIAGVRISLGGYADDDFSTPQSDIEAGVRRGNDRKVANILGRVRMGPDVNASLELSHSEANAPEIAPLGTSFYTQYRTNSLKAYVSANTGVGIFQATAYGNWFKSLSMAPDPVAPVFQISNSVYVVTLRHIFKIGSEHTFRLSAVYRYNELNTTPLAGGNVHYDVFSGGAMWNWAIQPYLALTNAVRVDHLTLGRSGIIPFGSGLTNADWNRRSMTEVSFNSGIVWRVDDNDTIRATIARGVQLPNLLDLGGLLFGTPFGYAGGNPTLKPTIVMNYGLDWEHSFPAWNAQLQVRAFHETTNAVVTNFGNIQLPPGPTGLIATPVNIGNSAATGGEISLRGYFAEHWRWGLSYTPEVITDHFAAGYTVFTTLVDYQRTNPVHVVNANLGWAAGPWETDAYLRYESLFDSIQGHSAFLPAGTLIRIPDYVSVDARIAYRFTDNLTLAVSGQNLLDSPQRQTSAAAVERRVLATLSVGL